MRYDCTDHGFLKKITDFFDKRKLPYEIIDNRKFPEASEQGVKEAHYFVRQRDFQNEALNELFKCPMGLVHIGVGGGKTWIMTALAMAYKDKKFLITVPTKGLLTKTHKFLSENLDEQIGLIGDSNFDIQRVTVSTYSSLIQKMMTIERHGRKVKVRRPVPQEVLQLKREVDILLMDEAHHAKSKTQQELLRSIPTPAKIGFSGTFVLQGEDMVVEGLFGPVKAEKSLLWLIQNGYCAEPQIEMLQYPCPAEQLKEELHDDPHQRWRIGYVSGVVKHKWRNRLIAKRTKELALAGLSTLIMVRRKKHGRILLKRLLKKGIKAKYVHGTVVTPEIVKAREDLNDGKLQALICTSIFDEGEDIPNVNALILAVGEKSPQRLEQRLGRALRAIGGKTKAIVIDFQDISNEYVRQHSRKRFKFFEKLGFKVTVKDYVSKNGKLLKVPKISSWKRKKTRKK